MGSGASATSSTADDAANNVMGASLPEPVILKARDEKSADRNTRGKRNNIFDRQSISNLAKSDGTTGEDSGDQMDDYEHELVSKALLNFFFMQQSDSEESSKAKMDSLIRMMKREMVSQGDILITEGESGNKLYVVEKGELEVTINGELIRMLTKGNMLGELALLYDAPRSATIKCKSDCVLWSLTRRIFKQTQANWGIALQVERSRGLISSPELAVLSAVDLSRLTASLQSSQIGNNCLVYAEGTPTQDIYLIERGVVHIYSKSLKGMSVPDFEKKACIFHQAIFSSAKAKVHLSVSDQSSIPTSMPDDTTYGSYICSVGAGTLLGIGALRCKAKIADGWALVSEGDKFTGALSPFTVVVANDSVDCQMFTVEAFENLLGNAENILQPGASSASNKAAAKAKQEIKFDGTKFKMIHVLGSGSFGVVIMAYYKESREAAPVGYALKCLSKFSVVETGQLRHVIDERRLLSVMDCPFVLKLYGTYQTPHQLVMVTEALNCGDLWSVIYETSPFCDGANNGLPVNLCKFYAASLVLALDHVHSNSVVFRDLKPENVILDDRGYIRLIDFGFAKKVPFTKIGPDGKEQVYAKTYTLCGTPEYLAPELIFNLGHDQTTDVWAFGVLLHEMLMCITPFAPKRHDNVTELFTNIAMVKKSGLKLSPRLDRKLGNIDASSLITQLLCPEPESRCGKQGANTRKILTHSFFKSVDIAALLSQTLVPEFIPSISSKRDPVSGLQPVKSYNGDQKIFAEF